MCKGMMGLCRKKIFELLVTLAKLNVCYLSHLCRRRSRSAVVRSDMSRYLKLVSFSSDCAKWQTVSGFYGKQTSLPHWELSKGAEGHFTRTVWAVESRLAIGSVQCEHMNHELWLHIAWVGIMCMLVLNQTYSRSSSRSQSVIPPKGIGKCY